jgi:hypothetical protein
MIMISPVHHQETRKKDEFYEAAHFVRSSIDGSVYCPEGLVRSIPMVTPRDCVYLQLGCARNTKMLSLVSARTVFPGYE